MARRFIKWLWWPVMLRFLVFSLLTAGGAFYSQIEDKTTEEFNRYGWTEWAKFWTPIMLAWLGVMLAFLDQTITKLREQGISETAFLARQLNRPES